MKILKRELSLFLVLAVLISCVGIGFSTKIGNGELPQAQAVSKTDKTYPIYFYVPELIYLTPASGNASTFKYYVDSSNADSPSIDRTKAKTTGNVYFRCADATAVSISCSGASVTGATLTGSTTVNTAITGGTLTTAIAQKATSTLTWTATYTVAGVTMTAKAYTVCYAPPVEAIGVSQRLYNDDGIGGGYKADLQGYFYVSGVQGYGTGGIRYFNQSGTNAVCPMLNTVTVSSGDYSAYMAGTSGGVYYGNWQGGNNQYSLVKLSPTGTLTVDTSRYNDINQIPNFTCGLAITNTNNMDQLNYYICDYDDGTTYLVDGQYDGNTAQNNIFRDNGATGSQFLFGDATTNRTVSAGIKYGGTTGGNVYSNAISGTGTYAMRLKGASWAQNDGEWNCFVCLVNVTVTKVGKGTLRDNMRYYTNLGLQSADYSNDAADFATYEAAIKTAAENLGNPTSTTTTDTIATAYGNLTRNTLTATVNHVFSSGQSTIVETQGFNSGDNVTFGPNSYTGYTLSSASGETTSTSQQTVYNRRSALTQNYNYTANTYTVAYNGNGYTGGTTASSSHTYNTAKALTTNGYSRTGYSFTGWNSAANGSGTSYSNGQSVTNLASAQGATVTLYAQWSINSYNLTFNANGGTGGTGPTSTQYNAAISAPAVSRVGYTLTGWSPTVPTNMPAANSTYTAQWSANTNTVYKTNHYLVNVAVSGWDFDSQDTLYGTTDTTVTAPVKSYPGFYVSEEGLNVHTGVVAGDGSLVLTRYYRRYYYNITFNADGGTGGAPSTSMIYGGSLTAPSPGTKTGHTFTAWSPSVPSTVGVGDATYTAQWSANTYYLVFDANGGGGSMSNQGITYNTSAAISSNAFSRTGYTFTGWNTASNGSGTAYANGATYGPIGAGNVTLYAQWSINTYYVQFNGNGSTGGSMSNQGIVYGQSAALTANAFSRTGYTFTGWNTASNGSGTAYANQASYGPIGAGDVTLYAQWSINTYFIQFNGNGSTGGSMSNQGIVYGQSAALTANAFSRTGYTFTGWNTAANGSGTAYANTASYGPIGAGNVTLYAQWSINAYTITFNGNGGTTPSPITQNYATTVTAPSNPTRTGYTFTGWSPAVPPVMPAENMECTAQWSINTYYVQFNANGGSGSMSDQGIVYGQSAALTSNAFARTGYTFTGWNTTSNGSGTAYTNSANYGPIGAGNATLYAQWTANTYYVAFNANTGTGSMSNMTFTYGTAQNLTANSFGKTGHTFTGWNTVADGSGTAYSEQQSINNLAVGGTITLYARWSIVQYTVTFNVNGGSSISPVTQDYGTSITAPADPTRTGYTFTGWSPAVPAAMPAENTQCVAQWSANQYTVTFNANGGSVSPAGKDVTYDSTYGMLPVPELEGYSLDGWFTGASGGTQVTSATTVAILAPQTLYAQWTMIPADFEELESVITFDYSVTDLGTAQVLDELGQNQGSIYLYGSASQRQAVSDAYDNALALQALAPLADTANNRGLIAAASAALSDAIDTLRANPNPAVYSYVDAEITQANQINLNRYTTASIDELQTAVDNVVEGKPAAQQSTVNGYAAALYNQRAGASALTPYQDNKAPKLRVFETTETMQASGISIDGFDPDDFGDISYVYPAKAHYTYYCYTNSENPVVLVNIADLADSNGRVSYPANMDVSKVSGTVNSGWMSYTYDGGTRAGTVDEGSVALSNNPYSAYSIGMDYDPALGADYYRQSGYLVIKPQFVQGTSKQFARYTISGVDDSSSAGNKADTTSLAGGTATYQDGVAMTTTNTTWTPTGTITIYVEYRNAMSLDSGTWYDDGRATVSLKAYNNPLADTEWVNNDFLYRISGGAANTELISLNDIIYPSNDPNYAKKGLACFYYWLDDTRDAAIISAYGNGSGVAAATELMKSAIQTDAGGVYSSSVHNWPVGSASISSFDPNTASRLVYVHLVDRWGNVFNKLIKTNNVDAVIPSFSEVLNGTVTLNESGGSGVTLLKLYQYAYEGAPQYVVHCYSDKLIATLNVINEPENVLDISVGHATVADGVQNRFTLYIKDKAGNERTQTVYTDSAGNLSVTVNDPDNMSPPQGKSMGARAMSNASNQIYTFLLNDTITVNLNNPTQPEMYTITFDLNGGTSGAIDPIELEEGAEVTAPADPARVGYTFAGWLPELPAVMPVGDLSCVAQWSVNEAIALVPAEGSNTVISASFIYGLWEGIGQEDFENDAVRVTGNGRIEIATLFGLFGTGTKVELIDNTNDEIVATYFIVIFGDVSGDGLIDSNDADIIVNYSNFAVEWDVEKEFYLFLSSDLNKDSNTDSVDSDIVTNCQNFAMWIDQRTGIAYEY